MFHKEGEVEVTGLPIMMMAGAAAAHTHGCSSHGEGEHHGSPPVRRAAHGHDHLGHHHGTYPGTGEARQQHQTQQQHLPPRSAHAMLPTPLEPVALSASTALLLHMTPADDSLLEARLSMRLWNTDRDRAEDLDLDPAVLQPRCFRGSATAGRCSQMALSSLLVLSRATGSTTARTTRPTGDDLLSYLSPARATSLAIRQHMPPMTVKEDSSSSPLLLTTKVLSRCRSQTNPLVRLHQDGSQQDPAGSQTNPLIRFHQDPMGSDGNDLLAQMAVLGGGGGSGGSPAGSHTLPRGPASTSSYTQTSMQRKSK